MERIWKGHQTVSLCTLWVFVERAYQRVTGLCVMATVYWRPGKLCRLHNHLYCILVQVGTPVTFPFGVVLFLARCKHFSFSNWKLCRMNHVCRSYVILVFIIVFNSCYFRHGASCNHWSACSFIKLMPFNYLLYLKKALKNNSSSHLTVLYTYKCNWCLCLFTLKITITFLFE